MTKAVTKSGTFRVFVVEDHPVVREAIKRAVQQEHDMEVCGEADTREQALKGIAAEEPDLAIVDLRLRDSDGLELVRDLRNQQSGVLSLVFSMKDELLNAESAVRAGARGYVSKQEPSATLIKAVRKVLGGEIYWSERAATHVASKIAPPSHLHTGDAMEGLSERELQVFEQIGLGHATNDIAQDLHIHVSTVETYRARIKKRLGLRNSSELLRSAIRWCRQDSDYSSQRGLHGITPTR